MIKSQLTELITNKSARVGVIGLGYVGLPLAVEFGQAGFEVIGFEVDATKTSAINRGNRGSLRSGCYRLTAPGLAWGRTRMSI